MSKKMSKLLMASAFAVLAFTAHANASGVGLSTFAQGMNVQGNSSQVQVSVQNTWSDLQTMGTTEYLGGLLGNFKLDESSMIAGAMTLGVSEFDNFLRTGKLGGSVSDLGDILTKNMTSAAGIDLSSVVGSFTSGGGVLSSLASTASLTSTGGAVTAENCPPEFSQKLVDQANNYITGVTKIASSDEYGFSSLANTTGGTTGFAGLSCLDKLFQNAGSDLLFKPPSLGNLTAQLQNWTCGQSVGIAEQIGGAFQTGIQTAKAGGFFPSVISAEANDGNPVSAPGMTMKSSEVFGEKFAQFTSTTQNEIKQMTMGGLFK